MLEFCCVKQAYCCWLAGLNESSNSQRITQSFSFQYFNVVAKEFEIDRVVGFDHVVEQIVERGYFFEAQQTEVLVSQCRVFVQ